MASKFGIRLKCVKFAMFADRLAQLDAPPTMLATAPLRGPGLVQLETAGKLILDPWTQQVPFRVLGPDDLAELAAQHQASILICEADFCFGPVLELPLLAIASTRGDPTNVDLAAATEQGIPVLCTPGRNADSVAELVVGLLFALNRRVLPADQELRQGEVFGETLPYQRHRAPLLAGQTVGLVGLGAVGRAVKWRLEALGLQVIASDPFVAEATWELDDLLRQADVVSLHATAGSDTAELMNRERFALMKPDALYLNTARAGLHDLAALTEALESGQLRGAAIDHFDGEQLPQGHRLAELSNVILTPHIGGACEDTELRHTEMVAADLIKLLGGHRPQHLANPEVWPD